MIERQPSERQSHGKVRAVVVTTDGSRHLTRWFLHKDIRDLGADEVPGFQRAMRAAQRLAERKNLTVKRIDGMFVNRANNSKVEIAGD